MIIKPPSVVIAEFDKSNLWRMALIGLVLFVGSVAMYFDEYILIGTTVPEEVRKPIAVLAGLLSLWFIYASTERFISKDPALMILDDKLFSHVNPGRSQVLRLNQITGVSEVYNINKRMERWVIGNSAFDIRTNRPEGIMASKVMVGQLYLGGDTRADRNQLLSAIKSQHP